ncbi:hypothetical protein [Aliagarivorans marinus]|uniref:hypothetical protein n=1 Tax=Aliagarivorans marinus TaxID=561965 RepID=UPI00047A11FC|nr:hypothetical protein [Aliagarivorans marinus]
MPHIRSQTDEQTALFTYSKALAGNTGIDWVNRVNPLHLGLAVLFKDFPMTKIIIPSLLGLIYLVYQFASTTVLLMVVALLLFINGLRSGLG